MLMQDDSGTSEVSVIINCLNAERYLREAIDSVYGQSFESWEIILWDNASTDGTAEIARSYDSRLRYFRGNETVPLGAARNLALKQARGEFIAFLDSDDLWLPEKLERQLPLFADPEVGLVYSDSIQFNATGASQITFQKRRYYTGYCFAQLLVDYCLHMPTVVIRRAALEEMDTWFDPRFNMIEEGDLFIRLAYRWKLAMVAEPLAKWRVHGASWTWSRGYLVAPETEAMIEKYRRIFPDFQTRYQQEIAILETQIAISRAKWQWKTGAPREARQVLRRHICKDKKAFILFFLTYLPEPPVSRLVARLQKNILPPPDSLPALP